MKSGNPYTARPGLVQPSGGDPGPSLEGLRPFSRRSRTFNAPAELLRGRATAGILGFCAPPGPYGPGDMLRVALGRGPGDKGRGA